MKSAMMMLCAASLWLGGCGSAGNFVPRSAQAAVPTPPPGTISRPAPAPGTAPASAHASLPGALRIMSFNVRVATLMDVTNHWTWRKALLVQTISEFSPDVLGTQELLDDQADYLQSQLPGYAFVGAGRNNGKRSGGEMCGVFYRSDRFTQLDSGHFWLSDSPDRPGSKSWGSWFTRMATWVKLAPQDGGEAFYVFNTHFDVGSAKARRESAKLIRRQIATIAGTAPVIITGDFNDTEKTDTYKTLVTGQPQFVDAFRHVYPKPRRDEATHHGFDGDTRGQRIDWILTSSTLVPVDAAIVRNHDDGRYPSDHYPVTAVVKFKAPAVAAASKATSAPVAAVPPSLTGMGGQ